MSVNRTGYGKTNVRSAAKATGRSSVRQNVRPNVRKKAADTRKTGRVKLRLPLQWLGRLPFPNVFKTLAVVGSLAVISLGFLGAYRLFTSASAFRLETIAVNGHGILTKEAIIHSAAIVPGQNILAINLAQVRRNLLLNEWISEATVTRSLPSTITLTVKEYAPLAVVDLGQRFLVNRDDRLFMYADDDAPDFLPIITGLDFSDLDAYGNPGSLAFQAALDAVRTGQKVEPLMPGMNLRSVVADHEAGIAVEAFDNIEAVSLGFRDYFDKFRQLNRVLRDWEAAGNGRRIAKINFEGSGRAVLELAAEGL